MHFITSNYNNIFSNSNWDKIKNEAKVDSNFNNFFLSLNDQKILDNHDAFHIKLFINDHNLKEVFQKIKLLKNSTFKNLKKTFFLYFFIKNNTNLIYSKNFNNDFQAEIQKLKINEIKNIFLNYENIKIADFSYRNLFYLKFPFNISYLNTIIENICRNIEIYSAKPYKLIILDCDNTLWGGVLDEDKDSGIIYGGDNDGDIFYQFQKRLKRLKNEGFILSIASKNNEKNVWNVMKKRKMILQKKDFIQAKINWNEKYQNIAKTLEALTLRAPDALFIDDNLFEVKKIKEFLPNINTIHISDNSEILNILDNDCRLQKINVLKEDIKKYNQYKIKSKFEELKVKNKDNLSFYKNLKQKINKININTTNFDRALQVFNKTNQFNFCLNRYNSKKLSELLKKKDYLIKLFELKDKFGSHGIIGAYICRISKSNLVIEDFALSCRVLSRFVEDYILLDLFSVFSKKKIFINYVKTIKNDQLIKEFLKKSFFINENKKKKHYQYQIIKNESLKNVSKIFR